MSKQNICSGDIVKIDVNEVLDRPFWAVMDEDYIRFIDKHIDNVFEVLDVSQNSIVTLRGAEGLCPYIFFVDDLVKIL